MTVVCPPDAIEPPKRRWSGGDYNYRRGAGTRRGTRHRMSSVSLVRAPSPRSTPAAAEFAPKPPARLRVLALH